MWVFRIKESEHNIRSVRIVTKKKLEQMEEERTQWKERWKEASIPESLRGVSVASSLIVTGLFFEPRPRKSLSIANL